MPVLEIDRFEIAQRLSGTSVTGIELGVAKGYFAKRMVDSGVFSKFYGVDAYSDTHDTKEYLGALNTVGIDKNYTLIRSYFEEALDLFPDRYFDFIYVDGYAHTGEMGGETLFQWLEKLKPGGIIAGDDYDEVKWPLVYEAVNGFVGAVGGELMTTSPDKTDPKSVYDRYVSWFVQDTGLLRGKTADPDLVAKGKEAFNRKRAAFGGAPRIEKNIQCNDTPAKILNTPTGLNLKASKLKDTGVGKIMVIVANGPTHKEAALDQLADVNKVDILMVNRPDERIWPTDFWLFCDPALVSTYRLYWDTYQGTIINTRHVTETKANSVTLQTIPDITFSSDIEAGVHIGRTSTYVALQVAMYMNYDQIFIFGCDMGKVGGKLYSWGENPNARSDLRETRFIKEAKSFQYFVDNALPHELEKVIFCSLENDWPFMKSVNKMDHNTAVDKILQIVGASAGQSRFRSLG